MAKEFMTSAKELAWKAYLAGMQKATPVKIEENDIREGFENWWSFNYGNIDSTKFIPEHNVYVEGHRYIKAE
jgi:hypothetical protein